MKQYIEEEIRSHYHDLTKLLIDRKMTITTMESATSGQIASLITDTEGSSAVLKGAFITYCNEAKIMQGVPREIIERYSVYSRETAEAMAAACKKAYSANIGIGVTGTMGNLDLSNPEASVPGQVYYAIDAGSGMHSYAIELAPQPTRLLYKLAVAEEVYEALIGELYSHRRPAMYIIFDMDGVILDSEKVYLDAYWEIAAEYGLNGEILHEAAIRSIGTTFETTCEIMRGAFRSMKERIQCGEAEEKTPCDSAEGNEACVTINGLTADDVIRMGREYFVRVAAEGKIDLKPGVHEILSYLKQRGAVAGLASSSTRQVIEEELGKAGVLHYFDVIVSGDMVTHSKPHPEIFLRCARAMGVPEEEIGEVVVIEDSRNGIRAAHAAGMRPVMVPDLIPPTEELRQMCAAVLPSLADVVEWLGR